jgi:hypothetical protein
MNAHSRSQASRVFKIVGLSTLCAGLWSQRAQAQLIPLLDSSDSAIAIDLDAVFVGPVNNGRYPAIENPPKAIDGLTNTKYLNFGAAGSGFIVTPTTLPGIPVDGFRITTANDAPARDPSSYELYGFNGTLTTTDSGPTPAINQTGLAEMWTLISSGALALPGDPANNTDQRGVVGPMVAVNSTTPFQNYKMVFPTIKDPGRSNIMQIAEIQFFADDTDTNSGFLSPTDPTIAVDQTPTPAGFQGSSFPNNERPALALDQSRDPVTGRPNTKYLNFGEERSGIIITNSTGPVQVNFMGLTTANDAVERDPASYELYGTNDAVTSEQNSNSNGAEQWTLISSGVLSLPGVLPTGGTDDARGEGVIIPINSPTPYTSYRLIFPTVKDAAAANSMQIADIQFYSGVPEPGSMLLVVGAMAILGRSRRNR